METDCGVTATSSTNRRSSVAETIVRGSNWEGVGGVSEREREINSAWSETPGHYTVQFIQVWMN